MTIYGDGSGGEYECLECGYVWTSRTKYSDPKRCPNCGACFDEFVD